MEDSPNDRMVYRTATGHPDKDGHLSRVDLTDLTVTLPSIEERVELNNSGIPLRTRGCRSWNAFVIVTIICIWNVVVVDNCLLFQRVLKVLYVFWKFWLHTQPVLSVSICFLSDSENKWIVWNVSRDNVDHSAVSTHTWSQSSGWVGCSIHKEKNPCYLIFEALLCVWVKRCVIS